MKTFREYKDFISCDLYRYGEGVNVKAFLKMLFTIPGFRLTYYMRTCDYLKYNKARLILLFVPFLITYILFKRIQVKYGFFFSLGSNIGKGLYINHFGCLGIHNECVVGKNLTIFFGAIVAYQGRGKKEGVAVIGNNVFLAAGAKVIGKVKIGNNVLIGANAVVDFDVPDNAVVAGNPGKIISYNGTGNMVRYSCD